MLVAIEGIDGAGKGTLTRNLVDRASVAGFKAESLSFPRYEETCFSKLVGQYLNGEFGKIEKVPVHFVSLLYAGDRLESRDLLSAKLGANDFVFLDRYVTSNVAYNSAKVELEDRETFTRWLENTEYQIFKLPRPELTILIKTNSDVAQDLVGRKDDRSYTTRTHDLHEENAEFLEKVAVIYNAMAVQYKETWSVINSMEGSRLRSPEELAEEAWNAIARLL